MNEPRKMHVKRADAPLFSAKCYISASNIMITACDFFNQDYRGAVRAEYTPPYGGSVYVSYESLAYFFNQLLSRIFGDTTVFINMRTEGERFEIECKFKSTGEIEPLDHFRLSKIASDAGFRLALTDNGEETTVNLCTKLYVPQTLVVYSVKTSNIKNALAKYLISD